MIYKYRNIDKYTEDMITNNNIFFSNPLKYNDPFDTIINFFFEGNYELLYKKFIDWGIDNPKEFAKSLSKYREFPNIYKEYPDLLNSSVCCFSEENDNILLWSHYANNHEGICLEYETIEYDGKPSLLFDAKDMKINYPVQLLKVNYIDKPLPKINALYTQYFTEQLVEYLSTKYKIWENEKEIRCIIPNSKFYNHPNAKLEKNTLCGIIFGLKIKEHVKNGIKSLAKKNHKNIKFYSAIQIPNEYRIEIIQEF